MPQARVVGLGKVGATGMSWYKNRVPVLTHCHISMYMYMLTHCHIHAWPGTGGSISCTVGYSTLFQYGEC